MRTRRREDILYFKGYEQKTNSKFEIGQPAKSWVGLPFLPVFSVLSASDSMRLVVYIALVVLAVVVAQIYVPSATPEVTIEEKLLESMMSISGGSSSLQGAPVYYKKVAIGYNTNTDLVTNAVAVAKALGHEKPPEFEKPANRISNIHDFLALLGYFMTDGSAVERVITDYDTCRTIVDAARLTEGMYHLFFRPNFKNSF